MILYKDNPNLEQRVVETFDGNKEYRINCKNIKHQYYVIDKDCFFVDGTWLRKSLLEFDHETKRWIKKKEAEKLINGIVDFDASGSPVFGYFSPNPYNNCKFSDAKGKINIVLNQDILIQNNKLENYSTGVWYSQGVISVKAAQTPQNVIDHTSKGYNIEDNKEEFQVKKMLFESYHPPLSKDVKSYASMLGDTTIGLEIECAKGNLPEHIQNRLGIVICRDGSLKDETGKPGPEFVTVPMSGAKALQTISTCSKELTKRTTIDLNCSFHAHFGTIETSRDYLVTLFRLCIKIQNEIFQMFPYYKANPDGIKSKNYNKKLPTLGIFKANPKMQKEQFEEYINTAYKQIFCWLAEGHFPDKQRNRKNKKHPAAAKWDRHERYYWINFMNTIFSERNTIEFRLHGPTRNAQKMINWIFICNAILKYAMKNSHKILLSTCSISLNEVMDYYKHFGTRGAFLAEYLKAYIASRKEQFLNDYKKGDLVSKWDYLKDDEYVFSYNGVTNLF